MKENLTLKEITDIVIKLQKTKDVDGFLVLDDHKVLKIEPFYNKNKNSFKTLFKRTSQCKLHEFSLFFKETNQADDADLYNKIMKYKPNNIKMKNYYYVRAK